MKKLILTALILGSLGATAATTGTMPNNFVPGDYKGKGSWKDINGNKGAYDIDATATSTTIDNTYTFNGQTQTFKFEAQFGNNGYFDVVAGGKKIGEGYCMTVQCHYSISNSSLTLEETIVFYDDHLYRVGSKVINGKTISWEEALEKVAP